MSALTRRNCRCFVTDLDAPGECPLYSARVMELIAFPAACATCGASVVVTFSARQEGYERRGVIWGCPRCKAEHSLPIVGHVVSVRPADSEPLTKPTDVEPLTLSVECVRCGNPVTLT